MFDRTQNCKQNKITQHFERNLSSSQSEKGTFFKREYSSLQNFPEGEENCEFESSKTISLSSERMHCITYTTTLTKDDQKYTPRILGQTQRQVILWLPSSCPLIRPFVCPTVQNSKEKLSLKFSDILMQIQLI